jgi:hypothetical protein
MNEQAGQAADMNEYVKVAGGVGWLVVEPLPLLQLGLGQLSHASSKLGLQADEQARPAADKTKSMQLLEQTAGSLASSATQAANLDCRSEGKDHGKFKDTHLADHC